MLKLNESGMSAKKPWQSLPCMQIGVIRSGGARIAKAKGIWDEKSAGPSAADGKHNIYVDLAQSLDSGVICLEHRLSGGTATSGRKWKRHFPPALTSLRCGGGGVGCCPVKLIGGGFRTDNVHTHGKTELEGSLL